VNKTTGHIRNGTKRGAVTAILAGFAVLAAGSAYGSSDSGANGGALQPDGKIVAAGWVRPYASRQAAFGLMRYRPNGSLDKTFGFGGQAATAPLRLRGALLARAVSLQPNGKLVVAGSSGVLMDSREFGLARYRPNGSLDSRFGTGGKVRTAFSSASYANALALQPGGKIVAAGTVLDKGFPNQAGFALARYRANGSLDKGFGTRGRVITRFGGLCALEGGKPVAGRCGSALAVTIQPDGKILAVGSSCGGFCEFEHPYPPDTIALVRYKGNGTLDPTFGNGGLVKTDIGVPAEARSVSLQPDGKIVVAGVGLASGDLRDPHYEFVLARYNVDGSLDASFGAGGTTTTDFLDCPCGLPYGAEANAVLVQADGKIVAGGHTLDPESLTRDAFALARYNPNGSPDTGFGEGGRVITSFGFSGPDSPANSGDVINALALQPDGKIDAIGYSNYGEHQEQYAFSLARYAPHGALDPSFGKGGKVTTTLSLCLVPRLTGGPLSYAKKVLKYDHCRVGKVSKRFSHVKRSWVAGSSPGAGAVRPEGAKIQLFVSKGPRRPRG
jgi:uncharacterized delta-60 repeat protein